MAIPLLAPVLALLPLTTETPAAATTPESGLAADPVRGGPGASGPGISLASAFGLDDQEQSPPKLLDSIRFYGSLRIALVYEDDEAEIANNTSRVGVDFRRELPQGFAAIARGEWGVNLADSNTQLSVSDSGNGAVLESKDESEPFTTRLGYVGLDSSAWGKLTAGKQWSVYYDVTGWTDQFYVYGAEALGSFNAGTDGGPAGTGRADQSLAWRKGFGPVALGLQAQFRGLQSEGNESYGASLTWAASDSLSFGAAWNAAQFGDEAQAILPELDEATTLVLGVRYDAEPVYVALGWAHQDDNEVAFLPNDQFEVIDADGVELYARWGRDEGWGWIGGFNWLEPRDLPATVDPDYRLLDVYLGVDYHFDAQTLAYLQGRLAEGTEADGSDPSNSIVLGLRYGF